MNEKLDLKIARNLRKKVMKVIKNEQIFVVSSNRNSVKQVTFTNIQHLPVLKTFPVLTIQT